MHLCAMKLLGRQSLDPCFSTMQSPFRMGSSGIEWKLNQTLGRMDCARRKNISKLGQERILACKRIDRSSHPRGRLEKRASNVFIICTTVNLRSVKGNRTKALALLPSYLVTPTCGRSLRINTLRNSIHARIWSLWARSLKCSRVVRILPAPRYVSSICSVCPPAIRVMLIVPNTLP